MPESQRKKGGETRARLLAAAERHFAAVGFDAARMEDVAREVGIKRAGIFYYFRDKRALYDAVLTRVFDQFMEGSRVAVEADGSEPPSPTDRVRAALEAWIDFVGHRPDAARLILREAANARPGGQSLVARLAVPFVAFLEAIVAEGERAGEFHPAYSNPYQFISVIGGSTIYYCSAISAMTPDLPFDPTSPEGLADHKRDLWLVARALLGID
ncbi:MAG: TetR/AcrR family transcriptional regulator [Deltaproteobacteria bacterium]|nr:TetR/AcrR family transcriptional regulator [Deltaproteobacteria bacterium]